MPNFTAGTSFTDGVTNDVTAAKLNALVADAVPTSSLALASTSGTISNFTSSTANITLGTIANFTASTANITLGTIPTLTAGTTTGTAGVFTSGTITTGLIPTLTAGTTTGTAGIFTSGTIATLNSATGTIAGLSSTAGTISTLNSTTGIITGLSSTTGIITTGTIPTLTTGTTTSTAQIATSGTIATLNSTTGTITNLSTTLAGDFTISQGTGTLGASGVTPGAYGSVSAIPFLTVNAKGIITAATTGTFSTTPADGSITPTKLSQPITRATAVTVSGTSVSFTSIPSWARRITVMFSGISTSGTSRPTIRLGTSSGPEATGYTGVTANIGDSSATYSLLSAGFDILQTGGAAIVFYGQMTICNLSGNIWTCNSSIGRTDDNFFGICAGAKTLAATLDRIVFTTANGTDTFDSGTVNIIYEG
jgi:hypothetical protein